MSTYMPNPDHVGAGRPPCTCGAAWRLHLPTVSATGQWLACPEPYRPDTLEVARRELAAAEARGDEGGIFVARGNLQRLEGRRP